MCVYSIFMKFIPLPVVLAQVCPYLISMFLLMTSYDLSFINFYFLFFLLFKQKSWIFFCFRKKSTIIQYIIFVLTFRNTFAQHQKLKDCNSQTVLASRHANFIPTKVRNIDYWLPYPIVHLIRTTHTRVLAKQRRG